jgi:hypothetical protein
MSVLRFMKNAIITGVMAAAILVAGCGKKSSGSSAPPPAGQAGAASSSPVAQPVLTAWQQGDRAGAVSSFLAADWNAGPLFATDSVLSLSETQFHALSDADREAKSKEMMAQLSLLKHLAAAVAQAGLDAAAKGDAAQARKDFTSLKQFGAALETPDYMLLVQLVGKGIEKRGDIELAKLGP